MKSDRTPEMQDHNENGIASHWAYSEGGKKISKPMLKNSTGLIALKIFWPMSEQKKVFLLLR